MFLKKANADEQALYWCDVNRFLIHRMDAEERVSSWFFDEPVTALSLTGAGLFTRSFARMLSVDPGFRPDHLAAAEIYLPRSRYADVTVQRTFFDALKERVAALPGVESVALADGSPPNGYAMTMSLASLVPGADSSRVAIATVSQAKADSQPTIATLTAVK